jgi:hypothetical protein
LLADDVARYAADEACTKAQLALKPTEEKCASLTVALKTAEDGLDAQRTALRTLATEYGAGSGAAGSAADMPPRELAAGIASTFKSKLNAALEEKIEAQSEAENLHLELERVRRDLRAEITASRREVTQHETMLREEQQRSQQVDKEHVTAVKQLKTQQLTTEQATGAAMQLVEAKAKASEAKIAELTATIQQMDRARASGAARLTELEDSLAEERERAEAAQHDTNLLRDSLAKVMRDKLSLWQQVQELSQVTAEVTESASATWQSDDTTEACAGCATEFSLFNRKHHCRKCGKIFCGDCTPHTALLSVSSKKERVCGPCKEFHDSLQGAVASPRAGRESFNSSLMAKRPLVNEGGGPPSGT